MKIEGYKLNGYDATYRKALFNVNERGVEGRVLEISDVESGETFLLDLNSTGEDAHRIRSWRKEDLSGHGRSIHFGSAGFLDKIKYSGHKKKHNI